MKKILLILFLLLINFASYSQNKLDRNPYDIIDLYAEKVKSDDYKEGFSKFLNEIGYDSLKGLRYFYSKYETNLNFSDFKYKLKSDVNFLIDVYNDRLFFSDANPHHSIIVKDLSWYELTGLLFGINNPVPEYYENARKSYESREYDDAILMFNKVVNATPKYYNYPNRLKSAAQDFHNESLIFLAQTFVMLDSLDRAIDLYRQVYDNNRDLYCINKVLRLLYLKEEYMKAIKLSSKMIDGELRDNGRFQYSLNAKWSFGITNEEYDPYIIRALCKNHLEDYRGCIKDYTHVVNTYIETEGKDPNPNGLFMKPAGVFIELALAHYKIEQFDSCKNVLIKGIENLGKSNTAQPKYVLGQVMIFTNDNLDKACLYLSEAGEEGVEDAYELIKKHCN